MGDDELNLNDYFNEDEVGQIGTAISENLARSRHADYDEVCSSVEFNDEQIKRIFGEGDPAENAYQTAQATRNYQTPDSVIYDGEEDTNMNQGRFP